MSTTRIPEGKSRIMITLEDKVLEVIKKVASDNMRTVSNEIAILIKDKYMNDKDK